jgi:hypothetical protein
MRRDDMPILAGLRHVLEQSLAGSWDFAPRRAPRPVWRSPAMNSDASGEGRYLHS